MNKYESIAITIVFLIASLMSSAQVAVGQWQDHFSYNKGKKVIAVEKSIYLVAENGILKYDKGSSEIEKMTKLNILSDITPSSIAYDEQTKSIIIGYSSGNIDIIKGNELTNINDIKKKNINSSKTINSIMAKKGIAYVGCDFGIVTIDIKREEIKETWFFGNNGTYMRVNEIDTDGENIYVATTTGIYSGNLNDNLVDFSKWHELTDTHLPATSWMKGQNYNTIKWFRDKLIANYKSPQPNSDTIMAYNGHEWIHIIDNIKYTNSISGNNDTLLCSTGYALHAFNANFEQFAEYWSYIEADHVSMRAQNALIDKNKIWVADGNSGLGWVLDKWWGNVITINSPSDNNVFDIVSSGSRTMVAKGSYSASYTPTWTPPTIYRYSDYEWKTSSLPQTAELNGTYDLVNITIDPKDEKHYFISSWTKGLIEYRNDQFYKLYNSENSSLMKIEGTDLIRVGSTTFDNNGNLWVTNSLSAKCLHVMSPDGNWTGFTIPDMTRNIKKVIVTSSGKKWIAIGQLGGLLVFDDNGTPENTSDDRYKHLNVTNESGEIVSNDVYSIAEDKNGYIWVGTSKGVVVYYNPDKVFDSSTFWGRQIKVPRNDGTDNADLLLSADVVTAICVDGANCKWFGTQNGGAYYTSADGLETIHHFNTDNSVIPSDNIMAISIAPETGEVFFCTPKGIVSFRGTATEGSESYDEILAFPNPVKSDYDGPITIKGLVAGSIVKIADIAGNLVYEAKSTGGQLVWDGRNLNGNRVATGVYVVFASTEIGEQKSTTKIIFIK
ncbi:MAG: hypothetical protein J5709_05345 [Bacteroidales bacterium]|nr:hypothetical protein [Bacteroidales bacterium]